MGKEVCIIMAGGRGTRLWPLSTQDRPKQFVPLLQGKTLVEITYERMREMFEKDDIFFVIPPDLVELLKESIDLEDKDINIIPEPDTMDTAPALILSSYFLYKKGYNSLLVIPADHYIEGMVEFKRVMKKGLVFAKKKYIVTFGISPSYPATGYGYIEPGDSIDPSFPEIMYVKRFIEKPSFDKAKEYIEKGFLWNSGMFVWNVEFFLEQAENFLPNTYRIIKNMVDDGKIEKKEYSKVEKISVDFAIMEKSKNILTLEANFKWDDLGSWWFVQRYGKERVDNNRFMGNLISVESRNNIGFVESGEVVLYGVDNILVVKSKDKVLVTRKEKIDEIKSLINILKNEEID